MFGVGPTELAFFLVIVLLVVGPDRLPTFMRTVGKGLRQVRSASREFKDAIGLDELMREGDPFRPPPVRPPRTRPLPVQSEDRPPTAPDAPAPGNSRASRDEATPEGSAAERTTADAQPPSDEEASAGAKPS